MHDAHVTRYYRVRREARDSESIREFILQGICHLVVLLMAVGLYLGFA